MSGNDEQKKQFMRYTTKLQINFSFFSFFFISFFLSVFWMETHFSFTHAFRFNDFQATFPGYFTGFLILRRELLKSKGKQFDSEWRDNRRIIEGKYIDSIWDYMECDGENDPQYEHFLSKLKEHDKSYVVEAENDIDGVPRLIKYEAESSLEDEAGEMVRGAEHRVCLSNQQFGLVDECVQNGGQALSTKNYNVENFGVFNPNIETLDGVYIGIKYQRRRKGINGLRENNERYHGDDQAQLVEKKDVECRVRPVEVVEGDNDVDVEELIEIDKEQFYQKTSERNDRVKENLCESVDPAQPVEKDKVHNQRKFKKKAVVHIDGTQLCHLLAPENNKLIIDQSGNASQVRVGDKNKVHDMVKIENENQDLRAMKNSVTRNFYKRVSRVQLGKEDTVHGQTELMKVVPLDGGISSKKTAFGDYDVKNESDHCLDREGIHSQTRSLKCAKCSITFKKSDEKHLEGEGDHGKMVSAGVEILDIAAFGEKGIACPFVSSKKFHKSMVEDEFPEARDFASDEFREEVLRVLRKPFDKEAYKRYREEIKVGSYLDHHPDVERKLKKYRYQQGKCLIVLRGFFYWLQNLTREGAFQPWTDRECLAVEPPPADAKCA